MTTLLVTIMKTAEVEVNLSEATSYLLGIGTDTTHMSPEEIAESYVSDLDEVNFDPQYERDIIAVAQF